MPETLDPAAAAEPGDIAATAPAFSPLYRQIKALLLQSLQAGQWQPGEMIPGEMELAQRFGVSQGTVRKAIDELAAENLLMRRQGKGTFVATHTARQVRYRFLKLHPDRELPASEDDAPGSQRVQRHVLQCRRLRASAEVAQALALRTGAGVVYVRRVLSYANVPTILEDIWLPGQAFKGLSAQQMHEHPGPTYALFELHYGVRMVRADEKIRAVLPQPEQATLLQVQPETALLSVERVAYTYNDVPMELRRGLYRTDRHHYRNALS